MKKIDEIKLQGRGGQGVVTAGELLGKTAVLEGKFAQSIPTFGPERRGALATCSLRISDEPILLKCSATAVNVLCLLDPTIWHFADITLGLADQSVLIFNTTKSPEEVNEQLRSGSCGYRLQLKDYVVHTVDATGIALDRMGKPITNTAMIGAIARASGLLQMDSVATVLRERFGAQAQLNIDMATEAFDKLAEQPFHYNGHT